MPYSFADVAYLVDGWGWSAMRSILEETGDVDSEVCQTVMDLERALVSLANRHPKSAAIVMSRMFLDFGDRSMAKAFTGSWAKQKDRGIAYLAAYLSGGDAEQAYERGRWPVEREKQSA